MSEINTNQAVQESPAKSKPLCVAAASALLIDTDKGVRPCCRYGTRGIHEPDTLGVGVLSDERSLSDIMGSEPWKEVADKLAAGKVPEGCRACIAREKKTGWKFRENYDSPAWEKGITYLEINSTNVCTLQCRHCNHYFSHRWARSEGKPTFKPDGELLDRSLRELDLSHLERVSFKGGEPMVNDDVPATLAYLREIGRLEHVIVNFTTNGSYINEDIKELLGKTKRTFFGISVDGVGDVQTYIRHGPSENEKIEEFVRAYAAVPNSSFGLAASVMVYNIFMLEEMVKWWNGLRDLVPGSNILSPSFKNLVLNPPELSVRCLSDETRARLADRYEAIDPEMYAMVVRTLRLPFAGAEVHDEFVRRTLEVDEMFGDSVLDVIPELEPEMVLRNSEEAISG